MAKETMENMDAPCESSEAPTHPIPVRFAPLLPAIIQIKNSMNSIKTIATINIGKISPALFQIAALIEDTAQPQFFLPEIFKPLPNAFERALKTKGAANKSISATPIGDFEKSAPRKNSVKSGGKKNSVYSVSRLATAEFHFNAPSAKSVKLAADFTNWEKYPLDMIKGEDGVWFTRVPLAPGSYSYRFIVDGKWHDDPRSVKHMSNPFGTANAVMTIS